MAQSLSPERLRAINEELETKDAREIVMWSVEHLQNLFQMTAFGLSGMVILDILATAFPDKNPVKLVFFDTLYHFPETYDLVRRVRERYSNTDLEIFYPPEAHTREEFVAKYGDKLWETNELFYDYLVKVQPADTARAKLHIDAVFTGRRRSQGDARAALPIVEIADDGLVKVNPLAKWSFEEVRRYIADHDVPYNALLDRGYRSVGDVHSTLPVGEGEDERAGRWKGRDKTECGIHVTSRFAELREQKN